METGETTRPAHGSIVGVVGTGAMGQGIAQLMATAGHQVLIHDANPAAADSARSQINGHLARMVAKGKLREDEQSVIASRIGIAATLEALTNCDAVIEAIVEDLSAKQALFAALEDIIANDCILATNTSSLSVTKIAAQCKHPERVAGLHFFNPVPLMKVVEIIRGAHTAQSVLDTLDTLIAGTGHRAVQAKDNPGFIVNLGGRGYSTESIRILSEGIAQVQQVDEMLKEQAGFKLGPFELFDLTGLDVSLAASETIYNNFHHEPRVRPSFLMHQRRNGGLLGRKSGEGFYRYVDGTAQRAPKAEIPATPPCPVWVGPGQAELRDPVIQLLGRLDIQVEQTERPSAAALCLVLPIGPDATTAALALELDPTRTLALETLFPLEKHRVLMTTPATAPAWRNAAANMLGKDGANVTVINDSPGFASSRIVAHIVNIACDMAQQNIATPGDIDLAISLGLGYPHGPLAWGDRLGARQILSVLEGLHECYRDPRYRPSPWLVRRAHLGLSLLSPEQMQ